MDIKEQLARELYHIWQEAKEFEADNWNDTQFEDLPDKHSNAYYTTANRILEETGLDHLIKLYEKAGGDISRIVVKHPDQTFSEYTLPPEDEDCYLNGWKDCLIDVMRDNWVKVVTE